MWSVILTFTVILTFMVNTVHKESINTMVKVILKGNNQSKIDFKSRFMWEILFSSWQWFFFIGFVVKPSLHPCKVCITIIEMNVNN